jgi:signal transduction histidine kinase
VENPNDEIGRLASAFNDTLARLERSFEQLRRFTSDASHELRTPLTAIRSVGEVGLRPGLSTEQYRDVIASMLEESARLTRLVEGLLTIARADAGQIQLVRTRTNLLELAREAASTLEVLADEKSQQLSLEGDASAEVDIDPVIIRQVVLNLFDNAIKYSPAGGRIVVRVTASSLAITLEVRDSGSGIPIEHREKVFDRFYRVDEARSREAGGAGLGLAIARWGAEAHGGRLELECPDTGGCIFRMSLPASGRVPTARPASVPTTV